MAWLNTAAYGLSSREREIVDLIVRGLPSKQIAASLYVTEDTVQKHLSNIFEKVGVRSRLALVKRLYLNTNFPQPIVTSPLGIGVVEYGLSYEKAYKIIVTLAFTKQALRDVGHDRHGLVGHKKGRSLSRFSSGSITTAHPVNGVALLPFVVPGRRCNRSCSAIELPHPIARLEAGHRLRHCPPLSIGTGAFP
jgi:DNA-binding CsgD family transcriptional regulator